MGALATLALAAVIAHAVARATALPVIPLLLLCGVVAGSTGLLPPAFLEETLVLGLVFLLFLTGIELNPRRARAQWTAALRVGFAQFVLLAAIGGGAARLLGYSPLETAYLALALTASSTLVGVRLLQRRRQMFEPFGRLVLGVLLLQDLLVVLLVPIVTEMPDGAAAVANGLVRLAALGALAYAAVRWVAPLIVRLEADEEALVLGTLAVLFAFTGAATLLDLPAVVGAFIGGVSLSRFPAHAVVRAELAPVGDFFAAIFFVALGALIPLPGAAVLVHALVLAGVVVVVTPPLVALLAEHAGLSGRTGAEAGLLLAQTSELSLAVGLHGVLVGQLDGAVFSVIALATVLTMLLTPFLASSRVARWLLRRLPLREPTALPAPERGHVLVLGAGTTGLPLIETLLAAGREVVVLDDDPAIVDRLREAGITALRGDATDRRLLAEAGAAHASAVASTLNQPRDAKAVLAIARGGPVLVRVFEDADAEWVRVHGGRPIQYADAAAEGLLQWYDRSHGARD